ncbi:MAG: 2-hydroxyacid dehydrogenase [Oscillospiraceae bacterium]
MRILVTSEYSKKGLDKLKEWFGEIEYIPWTEKGKALSKAELMEILSKFSPDGIITELDNISAEVIDKNENLKFIGDCRGTPSNIDLNAAKNRNIPVFYTPGRNAQAVSELLVGMLIAFYRNLIDAAKWTKGGNWIDPPPKSYYMYQGNELYGKTVGFVGFGAIGQITAKMLRGFGCEILYYDPFVTIDDKNIKSVTIDEIFKHSDIVTVHLPVLDTTKGMVSKELISKMKSSAIIVNTARMAVMDSEALYEALKNKNIRGAIIDVFNHEPPDANDFRIIELENVLATPHICGATFEVVDHQSDIINNQIKDYFKL